MHKMETLLNRYGSQTNGSKINDDNDHVNNKGIQNDNKDVQKRVLILVLFSQGCPSKETLVIYSCVITILSLTLCRCTHLNNAATDF